MKRLLCTFPILVITLLWGVSVWASMDIAVAPWESERDAEIWSERVLGSGDPLYSNDETMPLNAFCGEKAFERVARERADLREVVERAAVSGIVDEGVKLCAGLLERVAAVDIGSLRADERTMIQAVLLAVAKPYTAAAGLARQGSNEELKDRCISAAAPGGSWSPSGKAARRERTAPAAEVLRTNVNLESYSTDYGCVDYFRLVLYQWEGIPLDRCIHISSFPPSRSRRRSFKPETHFSIPRNNKEYTRRRYAFLTSLDDSLSRFYDNKFHITMNHRRRTVKSDYFSGGSV